MCQTGYLTFRISSVAEYDCVPFSSIFVTADPIWLFKNTKILQ